MNLWLLQVVCGAYVTSHPVPVDASWLAGLGPCCRICLCIAVTLGSPDVGKSLFIWAMEEQPSRGSHQRCLGVDVTEAGTTQNVFPRLRLSESSLR